MGLTPQSGTVSGGALAGNPAMIAALMAKPARPRRTLTKQQRAARDRREAILKALNYTGSMDVRDIAKERPDIIKALYQHGGFSGGPGASYRAGQRGPVSGPSSGSGTLGSLMTAPTGDFDPTKQSIQTRRRMKVRRGQPNLLSATQLRALGLL